MSVYNLTGERDHDQFIDRNDMSVEHWDLLMSCSHSGECDNDVEFATHSFEIKDYKAAKNYLIESGIDEDNLNNDDAVLSYYLWCIAGDIQELDECESIEA